jgi:hypothetical protein
MGKRKNALLQKVIASGPIFLSFPNAGSSNHGLLFFAGGCVQVRQSTDALNEYRFVEPPENPSKKSCRHKRRP